MSRRDWKRITDREGRGDAGRGRDSMLALAASLLGGALICWSLLSYEQEFALLYSALSALLVYALITGEWETAGRARPAAAGAGGRVPALGAGAGVLLLLFSFAAAVTAGLAGISMAGLQRPALFLAAAGALLSGPVSMPFRRERGRAPGSTPSCYYLLAGSFVGYLTMSTAVVIQAGGKAALEHLRGWFLVVALTSGLLLVCIEGIERVRERRTKSELAGNEQYDEEAGTHRDEQADAGEA